MPIQIDDLRFAYSGGLSNALGSASLGGEKSANRVLSQTGVQANSLITGVSIIAANNNTQGTGTMTYSPSTQRMTWQPPGSGTEYQVVISTTGTYSLGGSDGYLFLAVTVASLPTIYKAESVIIGDQVNNIFPSVSPAMSLLGDTQYRCLYCMNNSASFTITSLALYIYQQTTGPDSIFIGLDPAGVGNGSSTGVATTIVDAYTAPAGVVFTEPLSAGTGLAVGTLVPGASFAFWEKRVVPPNSLGYIELNTSKIGVAVLG